MKFKSIIIAAAAVAVVWFGAPYAADFLQPDTSAETPAPSDVTEEPSGEAPQDEPPEDEPSTPVTGTPSEEKPTDEPAEEPEAEAPAEEPSSPISAEAKAAIVFVNKQNPLDASYKPDDLVVPDVKFSFDGDNPKKQMQREAAEALEKLFAKAEEDGIELRAVSGYRSYATQKAIFERNAELKGEEEANRTSAYPGQSEHQTGLAMDVSAASVNYALEEVFGETAEGIWLAENAASFGFIIRYPQDKEDITGYKYEPWHLRYLGVDIAEFVTEQGLTLEEFLEE